MHCRLFFLLAREAPVGVILRRGPSGWTKMIRWDRDADVFEPGQWVRARVYVRRCDLSPNGKFLLYFAARHGGRGLYSWTAISKVPYWTAVSLWSKDDSWGGGGMFRDNYHVALNHREDELARGGVAGPNRPASEHYGGEDSPLFEVKLARDGWKRTVEGDWEAQRGKWPPRLTVPEVWEKPGSGGDVVLRRRVHGMMGAMPGGKRTWVESFAVVGDGGEIELADAEWADWDGRRVVYAARGGMWGVEVLSGVVREPRLLANFDEHVPEPRESPEWAKRW